MQQEIFITHVLIPLDGPSIAMEKQLGP